LDAVAVTTWLETHYDLGAVNGCEVLRRLANDVFLVDAGGTRFIVKVYGAGWRSEADIRWELALVDHCTSKGVPVPRAVRARSGDVLSAVSGGGRDRWGVVLECAPGHKPIPPFTTDLYEDVGRAGATFHTATDDFDDVCPRPAMTVENLVGQPLDVFADAVDGQADRDFVRAFSARLQARLADAVSASRLDVGVCHGDLTLDNLHVTDDRTIVLYDVERSRVGWRATELQGWAAISDEFKPRWQAYLAGYASARSLREFEVEIAPLMHLAALEVAHLEEDLGTARASAAGDLHEYVAERLARLRQWTTSGVLG
jgi:Ser/Thr protein kinase RdoA (MazF antagonist)